ncbi:MFS transporter [Microbispora sp. NBC_01189]|uniref:MFS transporter n=1 Tax=Microbispora sp. NBC_01189 TaxID=2903583 RepID=UPI002E1207FF|nr:MFS transporter [Microbispora sp. NBC_01189]
MPAGSWALARYILVPPPPGGWRNIGRSAPVAEAEGRPVGGEPLAGDAAGEQPRTLWKNRNFSVLLSVQTLSVMGDSFSILAMPLLVFHATGSVVQMGLLTGSAGAASILSGIFAGVLADRVDRRALLIACDVVRALVYGLVPLVWIFSPQVWLLYVVVPIGAALGMVFQVTYVAVVPGLVADGQIMKANSRLYGTHSMASVAGPVLAGLLSAAYGPSTAIAADAASFAVSAVGLCFVRPRPRSATADAPTARAGWKDVLVGARFLWGHPALRALTILLSFLTFLTLGLTDLIIFHLKHDLGQPDSAAGYVLASAAVGSVVAAAFAGLARRSLGFGACWIGSYALCGAAISFIGLSANVATVAVLATVFLFCRGIAGICSMSLRQEVSPDRLLGRVTAAFWTIHAALGPIGAALLTWGAARYGVAVVCMTAGISCLTIALCATLTPIRHPRPELLPAEVGK